MIKTVCAGPLCQAPLSISLLPLLTLLSEKSKGRHFWSAHTGLKQLLWRTLKLINFHLQKHHPAEDTPTLNSNCYHLLTASKEKLTCFLGKECAAEYHPLPFKICFEHLPPTRLSPALK